MGFEHIAPFYALGAFGIPTLVAWLDPDSSPVRWSLGFQAFCFITYSGLPG